MQPCIDSCGNYCESLLDLFAFRPVTAFFASVKPVFYYYVRQKDKQALSCILHPPFICFHFISFLQAALEQRKSHHSNFSFYSLHRTDVKATCPCEYWSFSLTSKLRNISSNNVQGNILLQGRTHINQVMHLRNCTFTSLLFSHNGDTQIILPFICSAHLCSVCRIRQKKNQFLQECGFHDWTIAMLNWMAADENPGGSMVSLQLIHFISFQQSVVH